MQFVVCRGVTRARQMRGSRDQNGPWSAATRGQSPRLRMGITHVSPTPDPRAQGRGNANKRPTLRNDACHHAEQHDQRDADDRAFHSCIVPSCLPATAGQLQQASTDYRCISPACL